MLAQNKHRKHGCRNLYCIPSPNVYKRGEEIHDMGAPSSLLINIFLRLMLKSLALFLHTNTGTGTHVDLDILSGLHKYEDVNYKILIKHKEAIQNYMMTGHDSGWQHCDRLSDDSYYSDNEPQITMKLEEIQTLNLKATFAYSTCLLVHYDVRSRATLSALFEFGWKAINHIRLAMVVTMRSGISLENANYTSNLPYMVAAQMDDGKEQFLCPVVGEARPQFGQSMCKQSLINYKNKKIRYGVFGVPPYFVPANSFGNGYRIDETTMDGTIPRFMKMLAEKLNFYPNFTRSSNWYSLVSKVNHLHLCGESMQYILLRKMSLLVQQQRN